MELVILIKREEANPQTSTSLKDLKNKTTKKNRVLSCSVKYQNALFYENDKTIPPRVLLCLDHFYRPEHRRRCCMSAGFFFHTPEHGKTNAKLYFLTQWKSEMTANSW